MSRNSRILIAINLLLILSLLVKGTHTQENVYADELNSDSSFQTFEVSDITPSNDYSISFSAVPETKATKDQQIVDLSIDTDNVKTSSAAGEQQLVVNGVTSTEPITLYVDSNMNVYTSMPKEKSVEITVKDSQIISASDAFVLTKGGFDNVEYMYATIEDAYSKTNSTPINGAAYEGTYLGTETYNNEYFVHVVISGFDGYMALSDVQIVPTVLSKANSYYINENGYWVYYEAIDPLTSSEYISYTVDFAPEWAEAGVRYYTKDDNNFTTELETNANTKALTETYTTYNYFQELPFRSASKYSGSQLKSFLSYKGKSSSAYYNSTNSFVTAQNNEDINALMLFAFANHESAYGTSTYAKTCNNFFGRGAYDSNPDNACNEYGFPTPNDGILAEALFLNNEYFDASWQNYNGTNFGNKSSGLNVKYASDPNWGLNIASSIFEIDQYLGGTEHNLYQIIKLNSASQVYSNSNLSLKVNLKDYYGNISEYKIQPQTSGINAVNVIVTKDLSGAYEIQLPTPVNVSTSSTCNWSSAKNGTYPNYEGTHTGSASVGTAYFGCDYNSFGSQEYYISKANTSKINSTTVISPNEYLNGSLIVPPTLPTTCGTLDRTTQSGSNTIYYYSKANMDCQYTVNSSGVVIKSVINNYSNGRLANQEISKYRANGSLYDYTKREYKSYNGKLGHYINKTYNENGVLIGFTEKKYSDNGNIYYDVYKQYKSYNSKIGYMTEKTYNNAGALINYTESKYSDGGMLYYSKRDQHRSYNGNIALTQEKSYHSNGKLYQDTTIKYSEDGGMYYSMTKQYRSSNGSLSKTIEKSYTENGKLYKIVEKYYNEAGHLYNTIVKNY